MAEIIVSVAFACGVVIAMWVLSVSGFIFPSVGNLSGLTVLDAVTFLVNRGFTNIWIAQKDRCFGNKTLKLNVKDFRSPSKIPRYYWMSWWIVRDCEPLRRSAVLGNHYYHLCPLTKHSKVVLIAYFDELTG